MTSCILNQGRAYRISSSWCPQRGTPSFCPHIHCTGLDSLVISSLSAGGVTWIHRYAAATKDACKGSASAFQSYVLLYLEFLLQEEGVLVKCGLYAAPCTASGRWQLLTNSESCGFWCYLVKGNRSQRLLSYSPVAVGSQYLTIWIRNKEWTISITYSDLVTYWEICRWKHTL